MSFDSIHTLILQHKSLQLAETNDFERLREYTITHHSTAIEGSTLTENETRLLLEEGATPKGKPLQDSLKVKDHYLALRFCIERAKQHQPVTESLVRSLSALVMKNTGSLYNTVLGQIDASKGEYRKGNVSAGGCYFPAYDKVERMTTELAENIQKEMNAIEAGNIAAKINLSFAAHYNLVSIHPFYDGNGRTSRLLMNYLQRRFDLPMAIVFNEDKEVYYKALQQSRSVKSIIPFNEFMCHQYSKHLKAEIKRRHTNNDNR